MCVSVSCNVCFKEFQRVAVSCSMLPCVAAYVAACHSVICSELQCAAVSCSVLQCAAVCCHVLQCELLCCAVCIAECVAVSCSVLQ